MTPLVFAVVLALAPAGEIREQPAGPAQAGPSAQAPPAAVAQQQPAGPQRPAWTYDPQGRRDPFVSLRNRSSNTSTSQNRPPGLAGVSVNEIVIRGIVRSGSDFVALAQAPDGRSFQLRRNARLFDGVVKQISIDAVVFTQEVNDPLSLVKQREVRKTMKPGDREEEL
jgi:type IV pilus assembly protein PilP